MLRELWSVELTQGGLTQAALRETERGAGMAYKGVRSEVPDSPAVYTEARPSGSKVK